MRKIYQQKPYEVVGRDSEHGRSTVDIRCPFCGTVTTAYIWSISGGGKVCDGFKCDVYLTRTAAYLLFPLLSDKQKTVLSDIRQFKCAPRGDGWYPNKRTLNSLIEKGLIKYDRFLDRALVGYQLTDYGLAYFESDG